METKERPILFSGPMVRAILEGRKTMTRRVVKMRDGSRPKCEQAPLSTHACGRIYHFWCHDEIACPYGAPGDRLWVRETWAVGESENEIYYRASDREISDEERADGMRWRPSIHMPRAACRILLEVTDVRVERLQEINDHDVCYEGLQGTEFMPVLKHRVIDGYLHGEDQKAVIDGFRKLWESINGPESWAENPWVWVVSFKRVESDT